MVQCLASFRIKLVIRIKLIILSSWDMPIFMRVVVCNTVYVLSYVLIQWFYILNNFPGHFKEKKKMAKKNPAPLWLFSIILLLIGGNTNKSKTPLSLILFSKIRLSIISQRSFTRKHRKYQKIRKEKSKIEKYRFLIFWFYKSLLRQLALIWHPDQTISMLNFSILSPLASSSLSYICTHPKGGTSYSKLQGKSEWKVNEVSEPNLCEQWTFHSSLRGFETEGCSITWKRSWIHFLE